MNEKKSEEYTKADIKDEKDLENNEYKPRNVNVSVRITAPKVKDYQTNS